MDENEQIIETPQPEPEPKKSSKSSGLLKNKLITIGVPLFIVQLVAVYFITANFLLSKGNAGSASGEDQKNNEKKQETSLPASESGKFIFAIEDVIVNPAGTDGKRLLLTSLGFDINSEEDKTTLQSKEIIIKDAVISTLSSTDLEKLNNYAYRDTLKLVLQGKLHQMLPAIKINKIYFSKFILQ